MKKFPILYKYTTVGTVQQWQIVVEDDHFWTIEGLKGGKLTESAPTVCLGKNIGKKNETSPSDQALKEAAARHKKKVERGYNETLTTKSKFFEPMLAQKLEDRKKLLFTVPTFISAKLDGLRCISVQSSLMSRNGKPFVTCPHLYQDVATLDGELYNHDLRDNFNKIVSLVKRDSPTKEELEETASKIKHYVYDLPSYEGVFSERYKELKYLIESNQLPKNVVLVPTYEIRDRTEIEEYHNLFLEQGYEGSIIRLDLGPYENKRSKQLLKYKNWQDDEFTILDVIEGVGNRAGMVGSFVMQLPSGETFDSNIKGEHSYLEDLWKNRKILKGLTATVKFFNYTPAGKPRFPYVIKIDRGSYE